MAALPNEIDELSGRGDERMKRTRGMFYLEHRAEWRKNPEQEDGDALTESFLEGMRAAEQDTHEVEAEALGIRPEDLDPKPAKRYAGQTVPGATEPLPWVQFAKWKSEQQNIPREGTPQHRPVPPSPGFVGMRQARVLGRLGLESPVAEIAKEEGVTPRAVWAMLKRIKKRFAGVDVKRAGFPDLRISCAGCGRMLAIRETRHQKRQRRRGRYLCAECGTPRAWLRFCHARGIDPARNGMNHWTDAGLAAVQARRAAARNARENKELAEAMPLAAVRKIFWKKNPSQTRISVHFDANKRTGNVSPAPTRTREKGPSPCGGLRALGCALCRECSGNWRGAFFCSADVTGL